MDPLTKVRTRTSQGEQAREDQIMNAAKGYVFQIDDMIKIRRFLILGSEGGTFYANEKSLTFDNFLTVLKVAASNPRALVDEIVAISDAGRAPKNDPALFALAIAASSPDLDGRRYALANLPKVARIGTHLFQFTQYVEQFRGWGPTLVKAVQNWYLSRPEEKLAYQMLKYRQRNGWAQRDVLRLSHPKPTSEAQSALFAHAVGKEFQPEVAPDLVGAFHEAQEATEARTWIRLIEQHNLSWEMLPDAAKGEVSVWEAMIQKGMPIGALVRQLPTLTELGVLESKAIRDRVIDQITDQEVLKAGRVHPVNLLVAHRTYKSGHGLRSDKTWSPKRQLVDALDAAFYLAFGAVEPANKRTLVALDVSGSMAYGVCGSTPLTPREASAAMCLVTVASESDTEVIAFTSGGARRNKSYTGITELSISPRQRLDDVIKSVTGLPYGGTDCSLPAKWAKDMGKDFDTITIWTDNETWDGGRHPFQRLQDYRQTVGHAVRQCVVGLTATECSIADPNDPHSVDLVGFDAALPNLISSFSRGDF